MSHDVLHFAPMGNLYDTDTVLWAERQADALRRRAANEVDWDNVAEEIEDAGNRYRDRIESRLATACAHLLKWQFQPDHRSGSWRGSIAENRNRIAQVTRNYPSVRNYPAQVLANSYGAGRRVAMAETGLTDLPDACPWTIDHILDHDFWPEE